MKRKVTVMHLLSSNSFSGAENVVCQIMNIFKNENIEMIYCSPHGKIQNTLAREKVNFFPLKKLDFLELKKAIKIIKPDIIHAHDIKASILASMFSKKCKVISHIHGNHEDMRERSLKAILFKKASKKFNKIIWVSMSAYESYYYKKNIKDKSVILYNIIDTLVLEDKISKDKNEYKYDIVYLGRLTYPKNPLRLIDVLKLIVIQIPDLKVAIIGNGNMLDKVKHYSKENGIDKNLEFLGFKENPFKVIKNSKIMIMTSRYEGTPMCALESMALGVPIVSTPTDGLAELITNDYDGFLSNQNIKLAEKAKDLITISNLREVMSKRVKEKSLKHNNKERYKNIILTIYLN